jgi:hypothetical protein
VPLPEPIPQTVYNISTTGHNSPAAVGNIEQTNPLVKIDGHDNPKKSIVATLVWIFIAVVAGLILWWIEGSAK